MAKRKAGDKNTKFFHATTKLRRKKNVVNALQDDQGVWFDLLVRDKVA